MKINLKIRAEFMLKRLKRTTSIVLCLALTILPVFILSCQTAENNVTADSMQQSLESDPDSQQIQPDETQSEFVPADGVDYEGYRFRILGFDGAATGTWQAMAIPEVLTEEETGEPINDAVYRRNKAVEELYNIEFGIVPVTYPNRDDFAAIASRAIMAGEDLFDAAFLLGRAFPAILGKRNMMYDLLTIPSFDLSKSWWDKSSAEALSINGKQTSVIGDVNLYSSFAPIVIYANKQLMQEYSIDNLYQLVRDGKWTWDALHEIARTVAKDLDGDGIITKDDQVGFSTQWVYLYNAVNSAGEFMTPKNIDDIPTLSPNIDKVSALVEKILPIFINKDFAIIGDEISGYNNVFFDFIMPKFRDGEMMFLIQQMMISFELRSMDADFAILPFPKYDDNQQNYGSVITDWFATFTTIPITCTDTERAANILQAMGYYSQQYITPAYYDVTITNKLMRDEDSMEMMDIILSNRVFDLAFYYNWGDVNAIFNSMVQKKANTFISDFEKRENAINAAIQKTLDELQGE